MSNIKGRYESLFNASLKELVLVSSRRHERLETIIMKANHNGIRLFLAAEQGAGEYENSIAVVINPRMINKAKEWIAIDYPKLDFKEEQIRETSVDPQLFQMDAQCNEQLREFLRPSLQSKEAKRIKGFNKIMKSYAQVLGIDSNDNKNDENNENSRVINQQDPMKKNSNASPQQNESSLTQTINKMQSQIDKLINLVTELNKTIIDDEAKKIEIIEQMNSIKDIETHDETIGINGNPTENNNEKQRNSTNDSKGETKDLNPSSDKYAGKRKDNGRKTSPCHDIAKNENTTGSVSYLVKWHNDENKRIKLNNNKNE